MTVSQQRCAVAIHDTDGLFFEGSRALDFTCCDVEAAILGEFFIDLLHGDLAKVLTLHSKERTPPHNDRRL